MDKLTNNLRLLAIAQTALSMVDEKQFDNDMFKNWLCTATHTVEALIRFTRITDDDQPHAAAARAGAKAGAKIVKVAKKRKRKK